MKKILVLSAMLAFGAVAQAKPMTMGMMKMDNKAEYRLRKTFSGFQEETHDWEQRFMFSTEMKASRKLMGKATLIQGNFWGLGTDRAPQVSELYATWMPMNSLSISFGRMAMEGMNGGNIMSMNNFEEDLSSTEGIMASYEMNMFNLSLWQRAHNVELTPNILKSTGATLSFNSLPRFMSSANVSFARNELVNGTNAQNMENYNRTTIGLMGNMMRMFNWDFTYSMESGADNTDIGIKTSMIDVAVSWNMMMMKGLSLNVGYHTDSGASDQSARAYDGYLYDRHANAGHMDLFGWGNLNYYSLGASYMARRGMMFNVNYHMFSKTETGSTLSANNTGLDEVDGESALGSEIDFMLTKNYGKNVMFKLVYSMFNPGEALINAADENMNRVWFQAQMNF